MRVHAHALCGVSIHSWSCVRWSRFPRRRAAFATFSSTEDEEEDSDASDAEPLDFGGPLSKIWVRAPSSPPPPPPSLPLSLCFCVSLSLSRATSCRFHVSTSRWSHVQGQLSGDEHVAAGLLGWNQSNWENTALERIRVVDREWAALTPEEQGAAGGQLCCACT
jgi:hypothetical protein